MSSPSPNRRRVPRVDFTALTSAPLTPLRRFVPTPIKPARIDLVKPAHTPRKKLTGVRPVTGIKTGQVSHAAGGLEVGEEPVVEIEHETSNIERGEAVQHVPDEDVVELALDL
jgi:hypothetical protein